MKNTASCPHEAALGEILLLLSELYQLPVEDMTALVTALEKQLARVCRTAVPHAAGMKTHLENCGDLESLKVEFCRLFVGPFRVPAPPYGSVYLDGDRSVMGESTRDVLARYKQEGLSISTHFRDAPDHITAELEFVCYLNQMAIAAAENGDFDRSGQYREKRKRFLQDHLGAWIPDFERHIENSAQSDFYKNLARATRALIRMDLQALSQDRCA